MGGAGKRHHAHPLQAGLAVHLALDHLAHGHQRTGLDALGHIHDHLKRGKMGQACAGGGAHIGAGHRKQQNVAPLADLVNVRGVGNAFRQCAAGQVFMLAGVFQLNKFLGQCAPHGHVVAVYSQHAGQGCAPGACTQNADICHRKSSLLHRCHGGIDLSDQFCGYR